MRERTRDDVLREAGIEFPIRNENTLADRILELETALADAQRAREVYFADCKVAVGLLDEAREVAHENSERAESSEARATRAEQQVAEMAAVVEAAEEWEFAKVQATAARMVAGATGRPVQAPDRSETLANMRLVSAVRAYRAAQPGDGGGE